MIDLPKKMWMSRIKYGHAEIYETDYLNPNHALVLVYPADQAPEPVARLHVAGIRGTIEFLKPMHMNEGAFDLYLAPPNAEQIRAEERERCAKTLELRGYEVAAGYIRSLK
jgi:hypothetical protein